MSKATPNKSEKVIAITTHLLAGLIFVLFSSCLPQPLDQSISENPQQRQTSSSGENSGAMNDRQFDIPSNPQGSSGSNSNAAGGPNYGAGNISNSNNGTSGYNNSANTNNNANNNANNNSITTNTDDCYKGDAFTCKVERLIGEKTNKYRKGRGLAPLALDAKIAFVARDWSQKQARSGYISHSGFPSSRMTVYRQEFNVSRSLHGENVAMTSMVSASSQDDAAAERVAEEFADMWWNSSGHRANMLGQFRSLGVGVFKNSRGSWYATQIFE